MRRLFAGGAYLEIARDKEIFSFNLKGQSHKFLVSLWKAKRHIFIYVSLKIMVQ